MAGRRIKKAAVKRIKTVRQMEGKPLYMHPSSPNMKIMLAIFMKDGSSKAANPLNLQIKERVGKLSKMFSNKEENSDIFFGV